MSSTSSRIEKAHCLPYARDAEEPLPRGPFPAPSASGTRSGTSAGLHPLDLAVEQLGLLDVRLGLEPPERVEVGDVPDVVLLEEPGDEFCAATRRPTRRKRVRSTSRSGRISSEIMCARRRSVLRRWASVFASALSVLTLAEEIALTPFAWASVRSTSGPPSAGRRARPSPRTTPSCTRRRRRGRRGSGRSRPGAPGSGTASWRSRRRHLGRRGWSR